MVSVEDSGTYTISCENEAGEGFASFELDVTPIEGSITNPTPTKGRQRVSLK